MEASFGAEDYLISAQRNTGIQDARRTWLLSRNLARVIGARVAIRQRRVGEWLELAREQLSAIADLVPGWDSHGGAPPCTHTIQGAWNLLLSLDETGVVPKPHIYPTPGGGVQLEWEADERYLEIELLSETEAEYFYSDTKLRTEFEGTLHEGESLDELVSLIDGIYE